MPWNKDLFGLQSVFCLDQVFNMIFSFVSNLRIHIVNKEWLGECVLAVRERHRLEMKSHHSTSLNISELVEPGGRVLVNVEELSDRGVILREVCALFSIPLLVVIDDMVSLRGKQSLKFIMSKDLIKKPDFIDGWFGTSVSDSGKESTCEECDMNLPNECLVEHEEGEGSITNHCSCPSVVAPVESRVDLVEVVSASGSPLKLVSTEDVVGVVELGGISVGLVFLGSVCWVKVREVANVNPVEALGRFESQVVVAWSSSFSEVSHWSNQEWVA